MTKIEIVNKLIDFCGKIFGVNTESLSGDTVISELGTKSLQRIGMCALIENEIDVVLPIADFGKYSTLNDLADRLIEELAKG